MAMTKAELMNAFRDAACAEFSDYSPYESDYTYEFSDRFERRMDRLIRAESRATWRFFNTNPRRLVIIAVVLLMALFAVACSVPEIRESIAGFFVRMFSDRAQISSSNITKTIIEEQYGLDPIPDGFSVYKFINSQNYSRIEYHNNESDVIVLHQYADLNISSIIDNEEEYIEYSIDETEVLVSCGNDYSMAVWIEDGYLFYLIYPSTVEFDVFITWIESVKPVSR